MLIYNTIIINIGDGFNMGVIDVSSFYPKQELQFINNEKKLFRGIVITVIKNYIAVSISILEDNYTQLHIDEKIEFLAVFGKSALRCSAVIRDSRFESSNNLVILDAPVIVKEIERREFERASININVDYNFLPPDFVHKKLNSVPYYYFKKMKQASTIDLSGSGIYVKMPESVPIGTFCATSFFINEKISALCSVVRIDKAAEPDLENVAFKIEDINESSRIEIINFVKSINKNK